MQPGVVGQTGRDPSMAQADQTTDGQPAISQQQVNGHIPRDSRAAYGFTGDVIANQPQGQRDESQIQQTHALSEVGQRYE